LSTLTRSTGDVRRIAITLGDPRGVGPEVVAGALRSRAGIDRAAIIVIGPDRFGNDFETVAAGRHDIEYLSVGEWKDGGPEQAGDLSGRAIDAGIALAVSGDVDGLVTGPISKEALRAAGYDYPGHTELLRERTRVPEVTMVMAAESTPLGGPLRVALMTVHVPLRTVPALLTEDLIVQRSAIAARGLREWWGFPSPKLAFAGLNPHASEGGLFGGEEARVIEPAMRRLEREERIEVSGPFPADTVFRRCIAGQADLVVVPYHDVGLAVLKTLAPEKGINVTTGLPFPRTSPDHGTAFDIAGRGMADSRSMASAIEACIDFCENESNGTERS
jgi:4-hydroxythreonine-4-phosphate dehydrogenase